MADDDQPDRTPPEDWREVGREGVERARAELEKARDHQSEAARALRAAASPLSVPLEPVDEENPNEG